MLKLEEYFLPTMTLRGRRVVATAAEMANVAEDERQWREGNTQQRGIAMATAKDLRRRGRRSRDLGVPEAEALELSYGE